MPTFKISQLTAVTSIAGTEELEVNQGGASRKATRSQLVAGLVSVGAVTASGLTMTSGRVLGRTTGATGAIEELSVVPVSLGGTGVSAIPTNGQVLIGNGTGYTPAVLTAGSNISITNGSGSITIAASVAGASLSGQTDSSTPFETALGHQAGNVNTGVNNTFIGYQAGLSNSTGTNNTVVGFSALDVNTAGSGNVVVGSNAAGSMTGGNSNVIVGVSAMHANTSCNNVVVIGNNAASAYTGTNQLVAVGVNALASGGASESVAVGAGAGQLMSSGQWNVFVGHNAGQTRTSGQDGVYIGYLAGSASGASGSNNVAIGSRSLDSATTGANNIAIGVDALTASTTAGNNTGVGHQVLTAATGVDNTAFGYQAGDKITTGTQNTILGNSAGSSGTNDLTTGSNNTIIGYNAAASSATISNEITLGNSSIATLRCQATTITALSDARDKANIAPLAVGMQFVQYLKPVSFDWAMRDGGRVGVPDMGFIAQDLQEAQLQAGVVIPGLVYESDPEQLGASYGKLLPVLVKALQELSAEVAALKAQIAAS
jgi:hypothetical protein